MPSPILLVAGAWAFVGAPPLVALAPRRAHVALCAPPEPPTEDDKRSVEPPSEPPSYEEEYEAGLAYGKSIRDRFMRPKIDDPGLPYADTLVCVCGALFVASLGLTGRIPRPGWLFPLLPPGVEGIRGLPYIIPAVSHGTGLADIAVAAKSSSVLPDSVTVVSAPAVFIAQNTFLAGTSSQQNPADK